MLCAWLQTCLLRAGKSAHPFAGGRAASLLGWARVTRVLLARAVLLGTSRSVGPLLTVCHKAIRWGRDFKTRRK